MKRAAAILVIAIATTGAADPIARPRAPLETVDISAVPRAVRRVKAPDSDSLRKALDAARPGDWIELQAGTTYS